MAGNDSYQIITDRIVEMLEAGTVPWRKPWTESAGGAGMPRSIRGHAYRGINVFLLAAQGYSSPYWLTFRQAQEMGGSVRKGEHGTIITFWKTLRSEDKETGKLKTIPLLKWYRVFNTEQCDDLKLPAKIAERLAPREVVAGPDPIEAAEAILAAMPNPPSIRWNGASAFYQPSLDAITMPPRESFLTPGGVYDTLFHEIGHSTGHPDRLNRYKPAAFGSHDYGREELIAEMTGAFLCGEAGIVSETQNNAAYAASWIRTIKEDVRAVIVAAGAAQRAADLVLGRTFEKHEEEAA